jgi:hypothetical protein
LGFNPRNRFGTEGVRENKIPGILPAANVGGPHISLVFREMWDSAALIPQNLDNPIGPRLRFVNFPHLAKTRDMGHPS